MFGRDGTGRATETGVLPIIRRVRRRWRMRIALRGLSLTLAAGLGAFLLSAYGLEVLRFSPGAVAGFRIAAWTVAALVAVLYLIRPLLRRVSDRQVALYLEEHEPSLEASILGAVEAELSGRDVGRDDSVDRAASPELLKGLVERAVERARAVEYGRRIEQKGLYSYSGALAGLAMIAVAFSVMAPEGVRHGLSALLKPTSDPASVNPYSIALEPGDQTVARGSDLFVRARLQGFDSEEVFLYTRTEGTETPRRLSMIPTGDAEDPAHELLLLGLQQDTEYYVEADGIRSPAYTLTVAELPYVETMDHTYRYPEYTSLPDRVVEDGGDVVALAGTRVDVVVHPTIPTPAGRLIVEGAGSVELTARDDGALTGTLPIEERAFYRVELAHLQAGERQWIEASPRYTIDVLRDLGPTISVTEPGRDAPVSAIEEVYLEAAADDDYGVDRVRMIYSVNGGPRDTLALFEGGDPPLREVTASHTLFLEEFDLEVGDMVSYFFEARDERADRPGEWVTSDIYFLQVRPFRRDFRQAEQQPGGGGGGGGQAGPETALSELQRQVVVATFNLLRDRRDYTEQDFDENVNSVALAQGRVREQVSTLVERMRNRGLAAAEEQFREIAEQLPEAIEHMRTAEEKLRAGEPGDALPPEQQALRTLQKAEETYERFVGQQQSGGGGGGGGGANASDLADLFELELDQLQNQYETVQRGEQQQQNAEVDELLEKLKSLSSRQLQELERQRRRAAAQQNASGGGGSDAQRSLAEETEEAARQLERLARETGDREMQETARELREAAEAMRRSAAGSGSSSGVSEADAAADRLAEAERRLRREREDRLGRQAREALDRADRLAENQARVQEELEELSDDPAERAEELTRVEQRKDQMQREVTDLQRQIEQMARDARQDDAGTANKLQEAADTIDSRGLMQKIAWSKGVMRERDREFAREFEEQIAEDIDQVRQRLEEAVRAAEGLSRDRTAENNLDRARELVRGAESLGRRLEQAQRDSLDEEGRGSAAGAESAEGQEGRRLDPNAQAGEQGQQGQQGQGQQGQQGQGQQGQGQQEQQGQGQGQGQQGQQGQGQQGQQGQGQQGQQGQGQQQQGQGQAGQQQGNQGGPGGARGGVAGGDDRSRFGGATRGFRRDFTPEEIRQYRRSFEEQLQSARDLRRSLAEQGDEIEDLDRAIEALQRLSDEATYGDLPQVALLQDDLQQSLKRVEFTLRREVEGAEGRPTALTGSEDVPAEFRKLVEEYFKSLARTGGVGGSGGG